MTMRDPYVNTNIYAQWWWRGAFSPSSANICLEERQSSVARDEGFESGLKRELQGFAV